MVDERTILIFFFEDFLRACSSLTPINLFSVFFRLSFIDSNLTTFGIGVR